MTDRQPLLEHQVGDIAHIHAHQRAFLGNDMGTGKSRSAITALDGTRTLVVAPSMVLESGNWTEQTELWANHPDRFIQIPYTKLNKRIGTGRGSGSRPIEVLSDLVKEQQFEALVLDEAHYIKGRGTSWSWAALELAHRDLAHVVLMTGTPIPNWANETFNLLKALHPATDSQPGQKFGSYWRWAEEWFDCTPTQYSGGNKVAKELLACSPACLKRPASDPCSHYGEFIRANFGDLWRRVVRDDADLPPKTETNVMVPLSAAERAMYRKMKKDFSVNVDGKLVLAWNRGSQNVTMDRMLTSPWLLNPSGKPRGGKLDRLKYDLENRSNPVMVLAHYRDSVEACAAVAESVGARAAYAHGGNKAAAAKAVQDFKAGKLDVLVGSLELVAEGLNLTVADTVIFVEQSYKPSRNQQAARRVYRMGQTRPVTILRYLATGPGVNLDLKKQELLDTKTDRQMRYMMGAEFLAML